MPPCQIARPILEPSDGLVGDAPPGLRVVRDREAKERSLPRPGDGTLFRVDLQPETPLDEASQILHDPVACLLAADIDVAVAEAAIMRSDAAGLASARTEGRVGGRCKKLDAAKRREIAESVTSGRKSGAAMARLYSISQPTVSRIVAQHRAGLA